MEVIKSVRNWAAKFDEESKRLAEVKAGITQIEQKITKVVGEIQVLSAKRNQAQGSRDPLSNEATVLHREHESLTERIEKLEAGLSELEAERTTLEAKRSALKEELGSPMAKGLSDEEIEEMDELSREVEQRKKKLLELSRRKNEVGTLCVVPVC